MALSIRERCERRLAGMKASREPLESEASEIARLASPSRTRFLNSQTNRGRNKMTPALDSHGSKAFEILGNGLTSGLSSSSRPWFGLGFSDEDMADNHEAKAWLSDVEKVIYRVLGSTNFYDAVKIGYHELGLFGTEACVMVEDRDEIAVCHPLTFGEYWIAESRSRKVDTLYRRAPLTVKQCVDEFGSSVSPHVRQAYDKSQYEQIVECFHAIEPNDDRVLGRMDASGKPFRSVWWDENDGHTRTLRMSGYEEQPFWAPRWSTTGSDVWGSSPGQMALPDLRELQLQTRRQGEAIDWMIRPEKIVPALVKLRNQPGSIVSAASVDKDKIIIPYEVPYQVASMIADIIAARKRSIDSVSHADLFQAITQMEGVQPRNVEEIMARNDEKFTQLGPVIERVNNEKLEPALERFIAILFRGGLLPPAPEAVEGQQLKVSFVSLLTQMQRTVGIGQIERTAGFIGNLTAVFPQAADRFDVDEAIKEYADRAGTPPKAIRSDDAVAAIRDSREQQANMEKMAAMAQPMQQGADAARLLSETDTGNGSLLQQMMPS